MWNGRRSTAPPCGRAAVWDHEPTTPPAPSAGASCGTSPRRPSQAQPRAGGQLTGDLPLTWRSPRSPTLEYVPDLPSVPDLPKTEEPIEAGSRAFRGVIFDWGGVMTNPIRDMVRVWLDYEDVDHEHYAAAMRPWVVGAYDQNGDTNPIHALERGECTTAEFEQLLAARIARRDGVQVLAEGLLTRLLSNSWGMADYPRHLFPGMFDVVVISGEVGMRKPEERIFRHAAGLLGLDPAECVFVDDIQVNVTAAETLGMTAILHTDPAATLTLLGGLLGLSLTG